MKKNCWEIKNCGRHPSGDMSDSLGVCPAAVEAEFDGLNSGTNAGRYCWKVAGTLCGGRVQGTFASKILGCARCDFYQQVKKEELPDFKM